MPSSLPVSYPAPNVIEAAAGTYAGQEENIVTAEMDDATAYELTKTFWEEKTKMAENAACWAGTG